MYNIREILKENKEEIIDLEDNLRRSIESLNLNCIKQNVNEIKRLNIQNVKIKASLELEELGISDFNCITLSFEDIDYKEINERKMQEIGFKKYYLD
jgi:hypothetical protein